MTYTFQGDTEYICSSNKPFLQTAPFTFSKLGFTRCASNRIISTMNWPKFTGRIIPRYRRQAILLLVTLISMWLGKSFSLARERKELLAWCDANGIVYLSVAELASDFDTPIYYASDVSYLRQWFGDFDVFGFYDVDKATIPSSKIDFLKSRFPESRFAKAGDHVLAP